MRCKEGYESPTTRRDWVGPGSPRRPRGRTSETCPGPPEPPDPWSPARRRTSRSSNWDAPEVRRPRGKTLVLEPHSGPGSGVGLTPSECRPASRPPRAPGGPDPTRASASTGGTSTTWSTGRPCPPGRGRPRASFCPTRPARPHRVTASDDSSGPVRSGGVVPIGRGAGLPWWLVSGSVSTGRATVVGLRGRWRRHRRVPTCPVSSRTRASRDPGRGGGVSPYTPT